MSTPSLRKLISIFLILAAFASSSVALLSLVIPSRNTSAGSAANQAERGPLVSTNAYVEELAPLVQNRAGNGSSTAPRRPTSNNLTENVAALIVQGVFEANPYGPQTSANGLAVATPNDEQIDTLLQNSVALALDTTADSFKESISLSDITIAQDDSESAMEAYADAMRAVGEEIAAMNTAQLQQLDAPSDDALLALELTAHETANKFKKIPAPPSVAPLHRSIVTLVSNQKNFLVASKQYRTDPIRTLAALNAGEVVLQKNIKKIEEEIKNFEQLALRGTPRFDHDANTIRALVNNLLGIETAHAIPVAVIVDAWGVITSVQTTLTNVFKAWEKADTIAKKLAVVALEQAKAALVRAFMEQAIRWAQEGGSFIDSWNGFLTGVGKNIAGLIIDNTFPQLCGPFRLGLQIALQPVGDITVPQARCTLDIAEANFRNFYNSFQNGDWFEYTSYLEPQNNLFGSIIMVGEQTALASAQAEEASQNDLIAGKGLLSIKKCPSGTTEESPEGWTVDGVCFDPDGNPVDAEIQTPGQVIGEQIAEATKAPLKHIVSTTDLAGFIGSLVNALLNRFITEGLRNINL